MRAVNEKMSAQITALEQQLYDKIMGEVQNTYDIHDKAHETFWLMVKQLEERISELEKQNEALRKALQTKEGKAAMQLLFGGKSKWLG